MHPNNDSHSLPARYLRAIEVAETAARYPDRIFADELVSGTVDPRRLPAPARVLDLLAHLAALGDAAASGVLPTALHPYIDDDLIGAYAHDLATRHQTSVNGTELAHRYPHLTREQIRTLARAQRLQPQGNASDDILDALLWAIEAQLRQVEIGEAEKDAA